MKFCLSILSLICISAFGQLSGDLVIDKRPIIDSISYTLEANVSGELVFDISVNTEGKVTSCDFNKMESTINSARYIYVSKNMILTKLKFEHGNGYPTHHRGRIVITCTLPE